MSRSTDSMKGTEFSSMLKRDGSREKLLSDSNQAKANDEETAIPIPRPPHRKTQSLMDDLPTGGRHRGRHHRHRSSVGQMLENIGEGVQVESLAVRHAWKQELEEGDMGNRYFFDMNLTRSLCVLPEDIAEFTQEVVGGEVQSPLLEATTATPTASLSSYLALLSAVLAVSSNGTALALLHHIHPAIKLFWRMSAVAVVLSFFALKTMSKQEHFFPKLAPGQWITFSAASVCFFLHTLLLFTALTLTSIGNAVIGANSQALLLVLGKLLTGQTVVWMEGLGVLAAFAGCILCSTAEAKNEDTDGDGDMASQAILGDMMALGSAATGVCYLTFAKAVRSHMSVTVFMFLVMLSGCVLCFLFLLITGVPFSYGIDPNDGLFGWMTLKDQHLFILLYVAIVCNVIGTMGFVRAMEYFENIIIAVATLLEPMIATLIAFALGVGDLPETLGWIGNLLVAIGTLGVVYPSINDKSGGGH